MIRLALTPRIQLPLLKLVVRNDFRKSIILLKRTYLVILNFVSKVHL
jgi:hypothetical protein